VDKITLDRAVFKALASDTRLDILKALDERQKTVTELARELDLNKATVFEHLEKLAEVGLIQKIEEDVERKWVYWQLSWTGRRLLHPETITLALILSTALGTLVTAALAAWMWLRSGVANATEAAPTGFAKSLATPTETPPVQHDPLFLALTVGLALAFVGLVAWAWLVRRQAGGSGSAAP